MTSIRGEEFQVEGKVSTAATEFRVFEDGALAHRLQEEEYAGHYSGNITRNKTVRQDIRTAKEIADEEALLAFKEEHEIVERNREIEERDREAAKQLYRQMLEEEKSKMHKQRSVEEDDGDIARRLQEHEKKKAALMRQQQQALVEENDEDIAKRLHGEEVKRASLRNQRHKTRLEEYDQDIAKRLQAHEERKAAILRLKQQEKDAALARRISQSERPELPDTPNSPRSQSVDVDMNGIAHGTASMKILDESMPAYPAPVPPKKHNRHSAPVSPTQYDPAYEVPMDARARDDHERETMVFDDDDRTNVEAEELDDAELARRLQREEIKKSRKNKQRPEMSDNEQKRLEHDERIARKMQHEEVMIAKNKYHKYQERVSDEVASPEPMTHVSRTNKTAVSAGAKEDNGITLTDYKPAEGAQLKRQSDAMQGRANDGPVNVAAAIDPTYSTPPDAGNVLLTHHKRSLNEGPPAGAAQGELNRIETEVDENLQPVQGSRRNKNEKESKKKKSIFSKLKKK
ncbi:uncharacterized protein [Amphiura filiformis]|uniref:uncharacterized protein isoform X2 n=1 Tax=Amphiura filiformis TaxID=82378 RepID=UPI003B223730